MGVPIDCGNASGALEDSLRKIEILAPYVLCSGMRDCMIWEDGDGVQVQETAVGEGNRDVKRYAGEYAARCPGAAFLLEIISGFAKSFPGRKPEFWPAWERVRPAEFARFLHLSRSGTRLPHGSLAACCRHQPEKRRTRVTKKRSTGAA